VRRSDFKPVSPLRDVGPAASSIPALVPRAASRPVASGRGYIAAVVALLRRPAPLPVASGKSESFVTSLFIVLRTEILDEDEWPRLREARLTALKEAPGAFLSNYGREASYGEKDWRAEFSRGEWTLMTRNGRLVGLLGTTREVVTPPGECYLEYLWVSPEFRRSGVATDLIEIVLKRLIESGVTTVWLWILEGDEPARRLYEGLGFVSANKRQPLPG
jgi:ribosomal protein S18 acetylase RimI-like enzyme